MVNLEGRQGIKGCECISDAVDSRHGNIYYFSVRNHLNMICLENVTKAYAGVDIFAGLSLGFPRPEIVALLGPSGCGKTTLLNIISGLDSDFSGIINFASDIDPISDVAYMLQDTVLLPWRTLMENSKLSLEVRGLSKKESQSRVLPYFEQYGIQAFASLRPSQASGGIRQRASLIRHLILEPRILLLDEPFSSLDFDVKLTIQESLIKLVKSQESLMIFVTHDIEDAISLSDRVIVLSRNHQSVAFDRSIDLRERSGGVIAARGHDRFGEYFSLIWDQLRNGDGD